MGWKIDGENSYRTEKLLNLLKIQDRIEDIKNEIVKNDKNRIKTNNFKRNVNFKDFIFKDFLSKFLGG